MEKKIVFLADNSYTIRRIVELSFSEIENIEVRSFENGSAIKEKLLQLEPAVVIVDIKLSETNGYEVCRFINETPSLNQTRVFLMKGSFEPVDNEMIKNLKYVDIVTKPFDSNALVAAVMKIVSQEENPLVSEFPDDGPNTFPEDFSEIETGSAETEDISFSDVREVMRAPSAPEPAPARDHVMERDEILPSEEITQGAQPVKDVLLPPEIEETFKNPFEEETAYEEIAVATPTASGDKEPEFEVDIPLSVAPAAKEIRDASDEFHDRFLDIADEDTSEDFQKSSLQTPRIEDAADLHFPADQKEEPLVVGEEKFELDFDSLKVENPAPTEYSDGVKNLELLSTGTKPEKQRDLNVGTLQDFAKELLVEKVRPEVVSPQDELAKLAGAPKKEIKIEPKKEAPQPEMGKFNLTPQLEDKLSLTIKEVLWEIVPPLAEKIIKEEIEKIRSELSSSSL
jgi:DNA-binding response OmpR family regulator